MDHQKKDQAKTTWDLIINNEKYDWHKENITGAEIRQLGNIPVEDEIFLALKTPWEDEPIFDDMQVNLERPGIEHFYTKSKDFEIELIVNARQKTWNEKIITFEQIVALAFGNYDPNPDKVYTITYDKGPHENPEGSLVRGEKIFVKNKMIFNVAATDKS